MIENDNNFTINFSTLLAVLVFLWLSTGLTALDPEKPLQYYQLDEWQISHGLPHNWIITIAQTPDGYLWIGTYSGLVKFDGARFEMIEKIGDVDITNRSILNLYVDQQGTLWIGTRFGLGRYKNDEFRVFNKSDGLSDEDIGCITEDMHGDLWLGTGHGVLNRLKNGKFTEFNPIDESGRQRISAILEDSSGNLWISAVQAGLFHGKDGVFAKYDFHIKDLDDYSVYSLYEDRQGAIWVGTNKGLIRILDKTARIYTQKNGLAANIISKILEDSDGNLWIATGIGINRLRKDRWGKIKFEYCLTNHIIRCLFEDREKSLWIGTEDDGLKRLRDSTFRTIYSGTGLPRAWFSLYKALNGDTLIGSHTGGLYKFNNGKANLLLSLGGSREMGINAIEHDSRGNLLIGTGKGLFKIKGRKAVKYNFNDKHDLWGNSIRVIYRDSRNILWIGTLNGLKRYANGVYKTYSTKNGLSGNIINSIVEDRKHNLWVGTTKGIDILENHRPDTLSQKKYFTGTFITCIYEDKRESEVFWIGAFYKGLVRLKNGHSLLYTKEDGLPGKFIFQILEDGRGNLWMSSDKGVIKACKRSLNEFVHGSGDKINCRLYGISDGMKTNQCSFGTKNSIIKTRTGELWFSTRKGIAAVHPGKLKINKTPPPILIKKIRFNYESVSRNLSGSVFKGIIDIRFTFTAPTFISPEKTIFKFKLEGYDDQWRFINAFQEREAVYKHLPMGRYSFKVSACNNDRIWNKNPASFDFTLKSYFYQTLFFKIAALLFFIFILAVFYYAYRKNQELKRLREKYKHSNLDRENAEIYKQRLLYLLEVEKVYLDENVTLPSLSRKLSISPRNLSQVINEQLNMNFCDLINVYRIEAAKRILSEPKQKNFSVMEIAFQVGFNSKASFYRAFRKHTGMTPSQYREKLKK